MKRVEWRILARWAVMGAACLLPPAALRAQAPPGPLPPSHPLPPPPQSSAPAAKKKVEVPPRKTLAGFWKLNVDESDDPQKKFEDARRNRAGSSGGGPNSGSSGGMGGPRVGVGYPPYPGGPGSPFPGPGGGPGGGGGGGGATARDGDYERVAETIRPAFTQDISLGTSEVDVSDEHANRLIIYTDGRKVQKSDDDSRQQISAHWDGAKLVSDETAAKNRKMSRTYELSPDGRQMTETWSIEGRRAGSPITVRYVYDAAIDDHL